MLDSSAGLGDPRIVNAVPLYFRSSEVQRAEELAQDAQYLDRSKDPRAPERWLEAAALYLGCARRVPADELPFTRWMLATSGRACLVNGGGSLVEVDAEFFPRRETEADRHEREARDIVRRLGA